MTVFVSTHSHRVQQQGDDRLVFYAGDHLDLGVVAATTDRFGKPEAIIGDVEGTVLDLDVPFYFVPDLKMGMLNWAVRNLDALVPTEATWQTHHCFCWSINRKTIDRYLVIKLVEWFALSAPYTWSGVGRSADCSLLFDEMDSIEGAWFTNELRSFLLSPIQMADRYVQEPGVEKNQTLIRAGHGDVASQWQHVQHDLASSCAVYLLTESVTGMSRHYTFSEKTGWALMAGNFPIWAGNYGQAQQAASMGIDVFSDVINHDYQWCDTVIERCYHAIADNITLLTDLSLMQDLRLRNRDRLLANREWYLGDGLKNYVDSQKNLVRAQGIDIDFLQDYSQVL